MITPLFELPLFSYHEAVRIVASKLDCVYPPGSRINLRPRLARLARLGRLPAWAPQKPKEHGSELRCVELGEHLTLAMCSNGAIVSVGLYSKMPEFV